MWFTHHLRDGATGAVSTWTTKHVERLLEVNRGTCYVCCAVCAPFVCYVLQEKDVGEETQVRGAIHRKSPTEQECAKIPGRREKGIPPSEQDSIREASLEQSLAEPDPRLQCDATDADVSHMSILLLLDDHTSCRPILRFHSWFQGICVRVPIAWESTDVSSVVSTAPVFEWISNPRIHRPRKLPDS